MTEPTDPPKTDPVDPADEPQETSVPVRWGRAPWPVPEQDDIVKLLRFYGEADLNVDPTDLIPKLTAADNQALTAAGVFGTPSHSTVKGADWSRYSGVVTDSASEAEGGQGTYVVSVWRDGVRISSRKTTENADTVEEWNKAVAAAEDKS